MADAIAKNLGEPDDTIEFPGVIEHLVDLGDLTVGRAVHQPGWRWSTHVRPTVGGDWCQARHVGVVLSGRFGILLDGGTTVEFGPDDVYEIPPAHDGFTIGHEPCVLLEWAGVRAFGGFRSGSAGRTLATLLMTDLVGSTDLVSRLGDAAWRERLSDHYEAARASLERFGGLEVKTTGDGMLARFLGPADALGAAAAIGRAAHRQDLRVRAAVHVGEVEVVGADLRGMAVHATARILALAAEDEVLVSDLTRTLAAAPGLVFEDRGVHELKGLPGQWQLFAHRPEV